ncbi:MULTISPECIES: hypothetical protein [unclassified Streptomyces]|uniref:hypothetical protein n=1 Tax=unclassified Streptomyces TaxID=2593676 RepID=UPI0037026359
MAVGIEDEAEDRHEDQDEARWAVVCLDALQGFDREETRLRLEPLIGECVALQG